MRETGAEMASGMTFGLHELIEFPKALWWLVSSGGKTGVTVYYERYPSEDLYYRIHNVKAEP